MHTDTLLRTGTITLRELWDSYGIVGDLLVSKNTFLLRYCRNVRPTWVKFNSKDTKESEWCFEVPSTKSKKRT